MQDIESGLQQIAEARRRDPLAPVTIIAPSHLAALQLRRRLAELTPFAGVRFEPLPRLAELVAAGQLAERGLLPLARPIADLLTERVAHESRAPLARIRELAGYARVLRRIFRRLRRAGIRAAEDAPPQMTLSAQLREALRLYGLFREATSKFYDPEDLLDEAAKVLSDGRSGVLADLGHVYAIRHVAPSAGEAAFLAALQQAVPDYSELTAGSPPAQMRTAMVLAPDPASEAREAVREVIEALDSGVGLHEVAVFYGADPRYARLLHDAFALAKVPAALMPGLPLTETLAGRAVLALLSLPEQDYARTAVMDFFSIAPLKGRLPAESGSVATRPADWDRLSRDAGITRSQRRWKQGLEALIADRQAIIERRLAADSEAYTRRLERERDIASGLLSVISRLFAQLEELAGPRPAGDFISQFRRLLEEYLSEDADSLAAVMEEVERLGTVEAAGGSFGLASFTRALRANLEARFIRKLGLGQGVLIADYRQAAGLRFRHVLLCGAYEGAFPSSSDSEPLVADSDWMVLRERFPRLEDSVARQEAAAEQARCALASASEQLVWMAPLYEPASTREYYPSPLMVQAAAGLGSGLATSTALRSAAGRPGLRRGASPLALALRGPALDPAELGLRQAVLARRNGAPVAGSHRHARALSLLRARRSGSFSEWDGQVSGLAEAGWPDMGTPVYPTSLEYYSTCGFRYFARYVLRLSAIEEPEERETMEPMARGNLVHRVLERFFRQQQGLGRPALREAWTEADREKLWVILEEEMAADRARGLTGLDIFAGHELRTLRADLAQFLEEDTKFRGETGALPALFEVAIPEVDVAGVKLRGRVDRIDVTPDKRQAWVIDYKTGSARGYEGMESDPLMGGARLQLPVYLYAVPDVESAEAAYWFITRKGNFEFRSYTPSEENQQRFQQTLGRILAGIHAGSFPAVPGKEREDKKTYENCAYCDFERMCSRRRADEFVSKSRDAAMGPWLRVARPDEEDGE